MALGKSVGNTCRAGGNGETVTVSRGDVVENKSGVRERGSRLLMVSLCGRVHSAAMGMHRSHAGSIGNPPWAVGSRCQMR